MKKGKCGEKSFPSSGIGEILAQSLTMDQIARLLDVVFAAGGYRPVFGWVQEGHPSQVVLPLDSEPSLLGRAHGKGLKEMDTDIFLSRAMGIWKSHLRGLVPDPASSHTSNYREHVEWMKALHELSHDGYNALLAQWYETHKRRRNLWREMKKHQLPI